MNEATQTERILADMLTENTGIHMLDSAGASGRNWQRNRAIVEAEHVDPVDHFRAEPEAYWLDYCRPVLSVFHFLAARLEYAPKLDRAWRTWVNLTPWGYGSGRSYNGISDAEEFHAQLVAKGWADAGCDFANPGEWTNTYNAADGLSQVIQWTAIHLTEDCPWRVEDSWGGAYHVLLSIHGGADVRGGYTDLRAFFAGDWDGLTDLFDNARIGAHCDNCGANLDSKDAGYSWTGIDGNGGDLETPQEYPYGLALETNEETRRPLCPACNAHNSLTFYGWPVG